MNNPFKYGELARGGNFCNRASEMKRIQQAFVDGQNIIIISPRRWGKSSLIAEAIDRHKGRHLKITLDCFGIRSSDQFYEAFLHAVLKASSTKMQQAADIIKKYVSAIVPYISYSTGAQDEVKISLNLAKKKIDTSVLDLAQKIAEDRKVKFIICIDEFQKISEWEDGQQTLETLRSHWQMHKDVCYCLYGSKRHLMASLFSDSSQPFYRFGETIFLQKIGKEEWTKFVLDNFEKSGKKISETLSEQLVSYTQCHSYYVQYVSRLCWNNTTKTVTQEILDQSFLEFLNDHDSLFRKTTESLTRYQVNYLKAFIAGERKFTAQRVLQDYDLGSAGNIKRIEKALEDAEIMDYQGEPRLCEPYFEPLFGKIFY